ncbi:uncharacterized protein EV422DRAFT_529803 [Fimicolochytrium jonesii]|uniref:uncharacterized protein n=1 Tax=Fimicolochytrium jonesii TaxID=1396493 RepID=UPI0022FF2C33|nr:uncharacterized protein EV422DRAFT_529803 [Fimicolochytrium jonesii]KAI8820701.1 hypothetical protein EV422DRAFT_529803 [Fimicolochytrium jonesii]
MSYSDPAHQNAVQEIYRKLGTIPIAAILKHREATRGSSPLIAVPETATVAEVMLLLRNEGILAVPVYRVTEGQSGGRQYTGIISIHDILAYTVFQKLFDRLEPGSGAFVGDKAGELRDWIDSLMEDQEQYFGTPIGELVGLSRESQESWSLNASMPVSNLLQLLTAGAYHRALIVDDEGVLIERSEETENLPEGSFTTMITQTDVLAFLEDCVDLSQDARQRIEQLPVKEINELVTRRLEHQQEQAQSKATSTAERRTGKSRVVTVLDTATALQAFRDLYIGGVSAVAVVDKEGGLAANLSASDLRGLSSSNLEGLLDPVFTFLEIDTRRRSDQVKADQLKFVEPDAPLSKAIAIIRDAHIHRVWIADEGDKPVGVVTVSDILSVFVPDGLMAIEQ